MPVTCTGLIDGATNSTVVLAETSETANNSYIGMTVCVLSGTGAGQSRRVVNYVGSTKTATITPDWITTPDTTSAYVLLGSSLTLTAIELGAVADAIWDEPLAGHVTGGTSGEAQNRLDVAVSGRAAPGDAMALTSDERLMVQALILSDSTPFAGAYINAAITSRSSHSASDVWSVGTRTLTGIGSSGIASAVAVAALPSDVWSTAEGSPTLGTTGYALMLLRKHINNRLVASVGTSANLVLYDDDDTTPLLTWSITDGSGGAVSTPAGSPARRSAAT